MILAQEDGGGGSVLPLLMIVLLFVVLYFLMIRPQQKRRQQALKMQAELGVGDEVVTIGGLYGTITDLEDETVTIEAAPGVHNRYARAAVSRVVSSAAQDADSTSDDPATDHGDSRD